MTPILEARKICKTTVKGVGKEYLEIHVSQFEQVYFLLEDSMCLFLDIFSLLWRLSMDYINGSMVLH